MSSPLPVLSAPGLPGIDRPLDNTALAEYMACPRAYWLSMVQHRRGGGFGSAALSFGSAWHTALEYHYRTGGMREVVEGMVRKKWEGHDQPDDYRTLERVLVDYDRYVRQFGLAECAETLGFPDNPAIELSSNTAGGGLVHPYAVKIDRIRRYMPGKALVVDHKTTSRLDKNYYKGFELSQQMMGYVFVAQLLVPSVKIIGVEINVAHVLTKGTSFERMILTYSDAQLEEWRDNTNEWMRRVSEDSCNWQGGYDGPSTRWPLAHYGDNGCSRKFGMCQFHRVCSLAPRIRQQVLEAEFPVNPWNPLHVAEEEG